MPLYCGSPVPDGEKLHPLWYDPQPLHGLRNEPHPLSQWKSFLLLLSGPWSVSSAKVILSLVTLEGTSATLSASCY